MKFDDNDLAKHKSGLIEARQSAKHDQAKNAIDFAIKLFDKLRGLSVKTD